MSLSRRDFITALIGTGAAALVIPKVESLGLFPSHPTPLPEIVEAARWEGAYAEILRHCSELYSKTMAQHGFDVVLGTGRRSGDESHGVTLTRQFGVDFCARDLSGPDAYQRVVIPSMHLLTNEAAFHGIDIYGSLDTDIPGLEYAGVYGPLRMVVMYHVREAQLVTRFDVLGGSSHVAARRMRVYRESERIHTISARLRNGRKFDPKRLPA